MKNVSKYIFALMLLLSQFSYAQEKRARQFIDEKDSLDYFNTRRFYYSGTIGYTEREVEQLNNGEIPAFLTKIIEKSQVNSRPIKIEKKKDELLNFSSISEKKISTGNPIANQPSLIINPANELDFSAVYHYNNSTSLEISRTNDGGKIYVSD